MIGFAKVFYKVALVDDRLAARFIRRRLVQERRYEVGKYTYGAPLVLTYGDIASKLSVGAYCSIGNRVQILLGGNHGTGSLTTSPRPGSDPRGSEENSVRIGNDVWIGREALILPGVQIGDGAIIGARAVVAKDVRPFAVVVGSPAREVRRRFSDEVVAELLDIAWWSWDGDQRVLLGDLLYDEYDDQTLGQLRNHKRG